MADPARIKHEGSPERASSSNEDHSNAKSEEGEDEQVTAKTADESKESSSQDHPKQEPKSVSSGDLLV